MDRNFVIKCIIIINFILLVDSGKHCNKDKNASTCSKCAPVCGTDGFTYTDQCFLKSYNAACNSSTTARDGACVTRKSPPVTACYPASEVCTKNAGDKPKNYDPVCGSDGKTYGNACTFNYERKLNPKIHFVKCGNC